MSAIKEAQRALKAANRKFGPHLVLIPREQWPLDATQRSTKEILRVWRCRDYLVIEFEERPLLIRLSICRTAINKAGQYVDGITWDELQRLKNEAGYGDHDAIEIYPRQVDEVTVSNMRHLWIDLASTGCPFTWRSLQTYAR